MSSNLKEKIYNVQLYLNDCSIISLKSVGLSSLDALRNVLRLNGCGSFSQLEINSFSKDKINFNNLTSDSHCYALVQLVDGKRKSERCFFVKTVANLISDCRWSSF